VARKDYEFLARAVDARKLELFRREMAVVESFIDLDRSLAALRRSADRAAARRAPPAWDADRLRAAEAELHVLVQRARSAAVPSYPDLSGVPAVHVFSTRNPAVYDLGFEPRIGYRITFRGQVYTLTGLKSNGYCEFTRPLAVPEHVTFFATEVVLCLQQSSRSLREPRPGTGKIMTSLDELPGRVRPALDGVRAPAAARPHTAEDGLKLAADCEALIRDWGGRGEGRAAKMLRDLNRFREEVRAAGSAPAPSPPAPPPPKDPG